MSVMRCSSTRGDASQITATLNAGEDNDLFVIDDEDSDVSDSNGESDSEDSVDATVADNLIQKFGHLL